MKWKEIREKYPNKWVKLQIINSHESENKEFIDEMAIIDVLGNDDDATEELVNCNEKEIVYHTDKEEIYSEIRNIFFSYRKGKN